MSHVKVVISDFLFQLRALRARGVQFLHPPRSYYSQLRENLKLSPVNVTEDLDVIEELDILIDYDDDGYLLQIFTLPVQARFKNNLQWNQINITKISLEIKFDFS